MKTITRCGFCYERPAVAEHDFFHAVEPICQPCLDRHNEGGTCEWCGDEVERFAIVSTAGARCADCNENVALCEWCGEAPAHGYDERCEDCAEEEE